MELPGRIHRSARPLRGQLQRQVMTTIRRMAWLERAICTALASRPAPGNSHSHQICELPGGIPQKAAPSATCKQLKVASIQFRRASPTPSRIGTIRLFFLFSATANLYRAGPFQGVAQIQVKTNRGIAFSLHHFTAAKAQLRSQRQNWRDIHLAG